MTYREDVEGIDASILMHPRVWEASGHVENFTDPMIDCKQCKARFRLDVLGDSYADKKKEKAIQELKENLKSDERLLKRIDEKLNNRSVMKILLRFYLKMQKFQDYFLHN